MLTVLSDETAIDGTLVSLPRQGHGDIRHLVQVKVADLGATLRGLSAGPARLEHVHDY